MQLFALADCNNFYVSCERVFNPALNGKPVIVLSNNDGCVVARSNEAKNLGIAMGVPFHTVKQLCESNDIFIFSSNYALYGDLSSRVMQILKMECKAIEVYSIDEAFLKLTVKTVEEAETLANHLRSRIKQYTGLPISIGLAKTKTLAKVANNLAKKQTWQQVFSLTEPEQIESVLAAFPTQDLWGVGRQWSTQLKHLHIYTAKQLRDSNAKVLRQRFSVTLERLIYELRGLPCLELNHITSKKTITSSRSFGILITDCSEIEEAISEYAAHASEKLRAQKSKTQAITIFLQTNPFRKQDPQHHESLYLPFINPTNDTRVIIKRARQGIQKLFRAGYSYKKAGILLHDLISESSAQQDLLLPTDHRQALKSTKLMEIVDNINQKMGQRSLFLLAQGIQQNWKMKNQRRSQRYTSCWKELPLVYAHIEN